jgi:hypothetical protein
MTAPSVPLAHYRQHNGSVTLTCLDCMRYRRFDLEAVIRFLEALGVGGDQTGVKAVAHFVREPCHIVAVHGLRADPISLGCQRARAGHLQCRKKRTE